MTTATRQEGPRAPLFYCALLIAPVQLALAQSVDVSELKKCAALEPAAARLACYEALSRVAEPSSPPKSPAVQPEAQVVEAPPEPADDAPAATPAEPLPRPAQATPAVLPVAAASPVAAAPTQPQDVVQENLPAAPTQPAATAAASTSAAESTDPMANLGIDKPDAGVLDGRVTKVTKDGYGRLIFHFDNGQEWRQIEKRRYPYPRNREFDVTISTGMMGEHRLQVEGAGRRVTIKRLR